jgi:hypothetical protein
LKPAYSDGYLK